MHGLINKAIQSFVSETYGTALWQRATAQARLGFSDFEAMLVYDDAVTDRVLKALSVLLEREREDFLEDLGTFLVTSPTIPAIRRLLRFSGVSYADFLHSLDELPDRVRLAVDDLVLPEIALTEDAEDRFSLTCQQGLDGYGHVMVGILRAMADEYGALALLDHSYSRSGEDVIEVHIVQDAFSQGRSFALGRGRA